MLNKELMIGGGAAVLAIVGIYYAIKSNATQPTSGQATTPVASYGLSPYASLGGATSSDPASSGVTVDTSQTGDLTAVLAQQNTNAQINANSNATIGTLNAINAQSATVLARGADLAGRGDGTLTLDYNQQSTAGGAPSANGTTTQAPINTQMTAHLTETVPDQHYAPLPVQMITPVVAPVIQQAPAPVQSDGGGCYITTAICKMLGLPDDCYQLQTLRKFRDSYMQETPERIRMVQKYYAYAPDVVRHLTDTDLKVLLHDYLFPAIRAIEYGDNDRALFLYKQMYNEARLMAGQ